MEQSDIAAQVVAKLGESAVLANTEDRGQHYVTIKPDALPALLEWMRDDEALKFEMLTDIGGVDYLDFGDDRTWRFEVAYQLYSVTHNHRFRIKVAVEEAAASVPSVWELYGVANWMEREVYDLFGIDFEGHPNQRRILCHDDFQGHALRKDYPINQRQQLSRPVESLLTENPDWA